MAIFQNGRFFLAAAAGLMVMSQAAGIVQAYGGQTALAVGATTFITGAIAAARVAIGQPVRFRPDGSAYLPEETAEQVRQRARHGAMARNAPAVVKAPVKMPWPVNTSALVSASSSVRP